MSHEPSSSARPPDDGPALTAPLLDKGTRRPSLSIAAGDELARVDEAATLIRERLTASGRPAGVATAPLLTHPFPTALGLGAAPRSPASWLSVTVRMLVVQWRDADDRMRTLLWEPWDHERSPALPDAYLGRRRGPARTEVHGTVVGHLRALGLAPEDVDFVAFASLRGLDLRRLLGTTGPASDLGSPDRPVAPWLPRARLLVGGAEWEALEHLHPTQRPWYQLPTFAALPTDRVQPVDGDVLVGPGVALLATPGRTSGHVSLALHTDGGVWVCSSNGIAPEAWAPHVSRMPGVRAWAVSWGREVLPRADDAVASTVQYDSMVLERRVADTSPLAPLPQCLPTAELTAHRLSPGLAPTHAHRSITHGWVRGSRPT
jgi:hypothetical protein